ncbi:ABC transporter permease [Dinghuibacter silviterrae]|uniref:ABC-type antimicrobial peptide transport system permease subunit n=1 Tax=Dinghuibacter silviterrae TaxID=1539049 RepID=A0A4R8DST2_9BACT|nr:ABC transporter permease [Dinghuibacter silviterrae]TDX01334.1 ABC-type antimicrobial peptide transport system permease subunit [Dinghuibacter silviterrae]
MLRNYLKAALRNLVAHKTHALVNIPGLVVGLAACLLIFLVLRYEDSFDNFHPDKDRIYRVVRAGKNPTDRDYRTGVPFPVPEGLRADFPQLQKVCVINGDWNVQVTAPGNRKFKEKHVFCADPSFFGMFRFPFLAGSLPDVFDNVAVTREAATKYFGDWTKAIGRTLHLYGEDMKVTGILENPPVNTDFPLSVVVSYATLRKGLNMDNWFNINDSYCCFVLLRPGETAAQFEALLPAFMQKHIPVEGRGYSFLLQPLREVHHDPRLGNFNGVTFSRDLSRALALIGLFLLVVASVNFINLSTAQAATRAREVGVRKVLGGTRRQLLIQFLGETALTCLCALLLAAGVAALVLPALNDLLKVPLSMKVPELLWFGVLIAFALTLMSGFYPALVLSGFRPAQVLKGGVALRSGKGISLRKVLVVFQLVIAQVLVIGTLVVVTQMNYVKNAYLGFDKTEVITASFPGDSLSHSKLDVLRSQLLQDPAIKAVSFGISAPSGNGDWYTDMQLASNHSRKPDVIINYKAEDPAFFSLYDMQFAAGRPYYPSDTPREYVVNETFIKQAGLGSPQKAIGTPIRVAGRLYPIVGVLRDFHSNSLRDPVPPIVMATYKDVYSTASIKIEAGKARQAIAHIAAVWDHLYPDYLFEYTFLDQTIADAYRQEDQLSKLYKVFSAIALFISCLGLYGLISFMAVRRNKEIGIRKVLGARIGQIVYLLTGEFSILILVAFAIAGPLGWYFTHGWLEQYAYRIHLGAGFFLLAIGGSAGVTGATIGYSAVRAATANPVKTLRSE